MLQSDPLADTAYRTLALIDSGGSARVYEVEHRLLRKRCVAKLLHSSLADDPQVVERMLREGKALAAVEHPNLVQVLDSSYTEEGIPYLIMERLDGEDLRRELKRRGFIPACEAVRYVRQAAAALHAAHCADIIHRDLKPENLVLHRQPSGEAIIKVLDLGLAKISEIQGARGIGERHYPTDEGTVVGTPSYMAPEQIEGRRVDARTDVYALGVVLFELLTGSAPFDSAGGAPEIMRAHAVNKPVPPSRRSPQRLDRRLNAAVLKALEKDPRRRFQSAAELELELLQIEGRLARPPIHPGVFVASAVVAGLLTFLVLDFLVPWR